MQNKNDNTNVIFPDSDATDASASVPIAQGTLLNTQAQSLDPVNGSMAPTPFQDVIPVAKQEKLFLKLAKRADVILAGLLIMGSLGLVISSYNSKEPAANNVSGKFDTTQIPLDDFITPEGVVFGTQSVIINGSLQAKDGLIIAPTLQPTSAVAGQMYYDQNSNVLAYYNGTAFVPLSGAAGVQSVGGVSGDINIGGGLSVAGGQLSNTGVLSIQGLTGNVALTGGNGITVNGTTISNSGVVSVTSDSPTIIVSDDGNGNLTLSGSGAGTVSSPGGTVGAIPVFTGAQEISDSIVSQSGGTTIIIGGDLDVTGDLTLGTPLSVTNGGTGTASLALNGVLVGQGAGAITSVTAGGAGLCLLSTVGAPAFSACPGGGGGVTSLEGLTGALTISNATGVGTNITIDDASTVAKGIASFNGTNFSVASGAVNTIQDINSGATPTFAGVNTNNITPSAALTVGISAQTALLQGSTTTITSNGVGADIILNSADTIELQDNTNVTGSIVASGDIAANGGDITSTGALNVTPGGALAVGAAAQNLTLQGNASTSLRATNAGNTTIVGFTSPTANTTLNFPALTAGTYDVCTTAGNCAGAGVTLQAAYNNSSTPEITLDATRGALTIRDSLAGLGANLLEVQNNAGGTTYLAVTATGTTVTGTATVSGTINSSGGSLQTNGTTRIDNSGNASNIGTLSLSGAISGGTSFTGSGDINTTGGVIQTNSTTRIDNSGNLTNIAAITASGNAAIQGGTVTLGTGAQQGSLVLHDGNGQTATISVGSALVANTALAIPTGVGVADTFCLLTLANCAGSGGGVTTPGGTPNTVPKFTGAQTIGDSIITDNGSTVTIGGTLAVNTISPTSAFVAGSTGQTATLQGSITTITSTGAGNDIVLNSADTIELQDNTNITGNLDVSGTIAAGTGNAFQVSAAGAVTAVGVNAGAGLLQGTLGLTVSGAAVSLNNSSNFATSINTGTSNGTITLGGGSAPLVIDSTAFDVTSGGALSGITTIATSGAINSQTISSAANFTGTVTIQGSNALTLGVTGTSTGAILFKGATAASGTITLIGQANPTGSQTITLPDASGDVCLTIGNCAGSGSGVTTSGGATNRLAKFSASQNIENSTVTDDGTNVTTTVDLIVQGGDATVGTTVQQGSLILHDGNGQTATLRVGSALGANTIIGIPTAVGVNDTFCLQTLANCTGSGSSSTLQAAYDAGNTITTTAARDLAFTLDNDSNLTVATAPATTGFTTFSLTDGSNATPPAQLLLVRNNDTNQALAAGLKVTSAAGTITTALDVSGTNITNALSIGANAIAGTNFSVTGGGAVSAVGVNSGAGLLQGTLGLTVSGAAVSLNNSSNFATNINTGTSNGTVTIGGGSAPLVIDSAAFDVTSGGAVSGVTTLNTSGIVTVGALGTADTTALLCRNAANQIASCATSGAGAAFVQGGNTFGATATLGTNDANLLNIRTDSTTRLTVGAAGGVTVAANNNLSLASGTGTFGQIYTGTTTDANTITANSLTTASAFKVTSSNNSAANTAWSANQLNVTNVQSGTAVSTGSIYGFDLQFTQNPTVAGNTESAANFALKQNDSSTTDNTVTSIINVANNDTATGNQITATNGLLINGGNITNGINLSGTFGTNLITSTNFGVTQAGAVTAVGVNAGAGLLQGAAGLTVTGAAINLNASSNFATNINTGTSNGTVTIGGGSAPLVIDSTAFDVSSAGAVSGVSTLALTGTNTISFTTPVGTVLNTKVGIPVYAPGSSDSIISLGLTSGAGSTARGISVFDARTVDHQPSIAVFSPDEASAVGFTWNGSNTIANIQTINGGSAVSKSISLQSGSSNTTSGDVTINSGAAATSGAVGIDVGAASVTAGALNIGITNANSITIGRSTTSNALTTVRGRMLVRPATGQDSATAFQVQDAGGTDFFTVNSVTANVILGKPSVATGRLQFQGSGSANALILTGPTSPSTNTITLPNETGTVCTTASVCTGYAASSGSGSYIQNQIASQQPTSNFWISSTGRADVSLLTPLLDTATAVALNIGTTNATVINLNENAALAAGKTLTVASALTTLTGATTGDALNVSNSTSTGNIALFSDNSTAVMTLADGGSAQFRNQTNSATAFQVQNATAADTLFTVDTAARSGSGGNLVKIGNSTGTDTNMTIFQLDGATVDPTSNLAALNGGMFYNSTTHKVSLIENGVVKIICNTTDLGCGTGTVTLQNAYANGNTITTTAGEGDLNVVLADEATDLNFLVDLQCDTSCSTNGRFAVQDDGTDIFTVLPAAGGITMGNDSLNTALTLNSGTGTINIGTGAQARTLNFGTGAAVVQTINIGGTGANVISVGNTQTAGSVSIGAAMTTGTINIGGTGAQTGTISIGAGTGAQTIDLGTGAAAKAINIGGLTTGTNVTILSSSGVGSGDINIGDQTTAGKRLDLGSVSNAGTGTVNIATAAAVQTVNIGSTNGASVLNLNAGSGNAVLNATSGTVTIQTTTAGAINIRPVSANGTNIVLGTAADNIGTVLVLDEKNGSGDPTAAAGGMYYNSSYGRMRCYYDGGWHYCNEYASLSLGYNITEDFVGLDDAVLIGENSWGRDVSGSGATVGGQNAEAGRPGIVELDTGTSTTVARAAIYLNAMNHEPIVIGGSEEIEFAVNLPTLADGTNDYNIRIGLCDNTDGTDCNSGLYFEYDRDTSANWIYAAANNDGGGSRTKTTSSTAVTTGWHRFRISVNTAANSVTYYVDGVSLGTAISTNIPTASTQPTFCIAKDNPTGAAIRLMRVDYFQMRSSVTTPR